MSTFALVLLVIAALFGVGRFVLPVSGQVNKADIYKDLAHVFVGFVFGAAAASSHWQLWAIAVGLTLLEVVAFIVRKKR